MKQIREYRWFLALFFFLLFAVGLLEHTRTRIPKEHYEVMLDAAQRTERAFSAVKQEKLTQGFALSPVDDPNQTGLIGEAYSEITTTLGSLEAKRSAINPNNAAMITDMLVTCGVKSGDTVAVNLSSSFPGLNTAVLCSLDAIGAKGIIINSVGASTYGANLPDFTWLDMEHLLLTQGLIQNHSQWFSLGGTGDIGKEMPEETKAAIVTRLTGYGLEFLYYEDLNENLQVRKTIYQTAAAPDNPTCLINVGGNLLSFGEGSDMVSSQNGILLPEQLHRSQTKQNGLIPSFLAEGIPVIHLLNLKSLLSDYGLPYDPSPLPTAGEGDVYTEWHCNQTLAFVLFVASLALFLKAIHSRPRRTIPL